jgi:acylpyruvate hydrolase
MRLISYESDWGMRAAVLVGDVVVDVARAAGVAGLPASPAAWTSNRAVIELGDGVRDDLATAAAMIAAGDAAPLRLADVVLGPPIVDPDKIVCLGLNYGDHAEESGLPLPAAPMLFAKFRNSLTGPASPIEPPAVSEAVDYEAELAVVIGRPAKDVPAADALRHVAGAMVFNDVTARDLQHRTSQWTAGKAIDTFAPCGPSLVTLDEIGDLQNLAIETRVNGEVVQSSNTSRMIFSVAETVAFISSLMTLVPGDIIATGTPAGVGISRDPRVLLRDGDIVEVEIEGLGRIANPVRSAGTSLASRMAAVVESR